ncbi:MAG: queuosine precursor transporter [Firmicutes bacterium]|nr:queuosine precursor transporter [Bacillota bacterium]
MLPTKEVPDSPLYHLLSTLFVTSLLLANITAGKMAHLFGLTLPAAVVFFPITYILGDVLTEVYGFHRARLTIWLGFFANLFMALVFLITVALPYPPYWTGQEAYKAVLGMTPRLVAASTVAYFAGSFLNSALLSKLKVATAGRWLWLRTIFSTLVGEGVDTALFIVIGFGGTIPLNLLVNLILAQYLWKVTYEILVTPLTYLVVGWLKRREKRDVFDHGANYNPFILDWRRVDE